LNTSQKIIQSLEDYVDTIYFVSGGGIAFIVDALGNSKINYIPMLCESGAVYSALGYAQARKGLGVAIVTSGPGLSNSITGIASAWTDSIPLLVIGGTARRDTLINGTSLRTHGIQEINGTAITHPITKCSIQAQSGTHAINSLNVLIKLALESRPGPVHLELPLDIQSEELND